MSLYTIKCFFIIYKQQVCFQIMFPSFFSLWLEAKCCIRAWTSLSESILCFCHKLFWACLQFHVHDFRVYLIADVKNTNSSLISQVSSVTFLKYWEHNGISPFMRIQFSVYMLFKNCRNLSLNSSGAYL